MADIIVHRQLQAALDGAPALYGHTQVAKMADRCNDRKYAARLAQDGSAKAFYCFWLQRNPQIDVQAFVAGIGKTSFTLVVPETGLEERVYVEDLNLAKSEFEAETRTMTLWWRPHGVGKKGAKTMLREAGGNADEAGFEKTVIEFFTELRVTLTTKVRNHRLTYSILLEAPSRVAARRNGDDDAAMPPGLILPDGYDVEAVLRGVGSGSASGTTTTAGGGRIPLAMELQMEED